jgi:hypothetical protein
MSLLHKCFRIWSGRWESNPRPKLGKLLYCHCTTPARFSDCTCELWLGPGFRLIHGIKREQHIGIRRAQVSWLERLTVTQQAAGSSPVATASAARRVLLNQVLAADDDQLKMTKFVEQCAPET